MPPGSPGVRSRTSRRVSGAEPTDLPHTPDRAAVGPGRALHRGVPARRLQPTEVRWIFFFFACSEVAPLPVGTVAVFVSGRRTVDSFGQGQLGQPPSRPLAKPCLEGLQF